MVAANNVSSTAINSYLGLRDETSAPESLSHKRATAKAARIRAAVDRILGNTKFVQPW